MEGCKYHGKYRLNESYSVHILWKMLLTIHKLFFVDISNLRNEYYVYTLTEFDIWMRTFLLLKYILFSIIWLGGDGLYERK
jgi:hypothetical protein